MGHLCIRLLGLMGWGSRNMYIVFPNFNYIACFIVPKNAAANSCCFSNLYFIRLIVGWLWILVKFAIQL